MVCRLPWEPALRRAGSASASRFASLIKILRGCAVILAVGCAVLFLPQTAWADQRIEVEQDCLFGTLQNGAGSHSGSGFRDSAGPTERIVCSVDVPSGAVVTVCQTFADVGWTARVNGVTQGFSVAGCPEVTVADDEPHTITLGLYRTTATNLTVSTAPARFDYLEVLGGGAPDVQLVKRQFDVLGAGIGLVLFLAGAHFVVGWRR